MSRRHQVNNYSITVQGSIQILKLSSQKISKGSFKTKSAHEKMPTF